VRRYRRLGMVTKRPGEALVGRQMEIEVLDRLLAAVPGGQSGVLVLRGEPGVGKTALMEHAVASASGFRLVRTVGIESEMELPFAALQQLCAPMMDGIKRLPDPQRAALRVAFGQSSGDAPDRFLVGLAVLSLLSAAAEEQPLLCVVDDARGLIGPRQKRLRSWCGVCWPSRSRSCSRRAIRPDRSKGCPSWLSRVCVRVTHARCWIR
jgi:AAA ATPase domain